MNTYEALAEIKVILGRDRGERVCVKEREREDLLRRSFTEMTLVDALRKGVGGGEIVRGGIFSLLQSG